MRSISRAGSLNGVLLAKDGLLLTTLPPIMERATMVMAAPILMLTSTLVWFQILPSGWLGVFPFGVLQLILWWFQRSFLGKTVGKILWWFPQWFLGKAIGEMMVVGTLFPVGKTVLQDDK